MAWVILEPSQPVQGVKISLRIKSSLLLTYWFGGESCAFTVLRGLEFTEGVARGVFKFPKDCKNRGYIDKPVCEVFITYHRFVMEK